MNMIEFVRNASVPGGLSSFQLAPGEVLELIQDVIFLVDSGAVSLAMGVKPSKRVAYALLGRDESPNLYLTLNGTPQSAHQMVLIGESKQAHISALPAHYIRNQLNECPLKEQCILMEGAVQRTVDFMLAIQQRFGLLTCTSLWQRMMWFEQQYHPRHYLEPDETWSDQTLARQIWALNVRQVTEARVR